MVAELGVAFWRCLFLRFLVFGGAEVWGEGRARAGMEVRGGWAVRY